MLGPEQFPWKIHSSPRQRGAQRHRVKSGGCCLGEGGLARVFDSIRVSQVSA